MVRCSECGFLAARNTETRNLEEVELKSRQNGDIGKQRYVLIPVCFAMAVNFEEEAKELRTSPEYTQRKNEIGEVVWPKWNALVKVILSKGRQCKSFTKWQQGFIPKEHQEILDRQFMLKWQAGREDADKKWRTRQQWFMVIVAGIFTILGGIIGVVITLIANHLS